MLVIDQVHPFVEFDDVFTALWIEGFEGEMFRCGGGLLGRWKRRRERCGREAADGEL
jgi:hypothetical protein